MENYNDLDLAIIKADIVDRYGNDLRASPEAKERVLGGAETKISVEKFDTETRLGGEEKINYFKSVGVDDDTFRNNTFFHRAFYKPEKWDESFNIHAKVFSLSSDFVSCDCLIDEENNIFEKRVFPRSIFNGIFQLEAGRLIILKIRSKKGSMRMDILDGRGVVDQEKFSLETEWESLNDF